MRAKWNSLGPAGIAAAMLAGGVLAQAPGPVVVSPRPELTWLEFYYLDASLELEFRRDVSRVDPTVGSSTKDTEDRFRELLELSTRGYVGHPNLLQLDLRGGLRFTQRLVDEETTGFAQSFDGYFDVQQYAIYICDGGVACVCCLLGLEIH